MAAAGLRPTATGPRPAAERKPVIDDYWIGFALGILMSAFVLVDLVFRPPFVGISVDSEVTTRATPAIVSVLHFTINALFAVPCVYGAVTRDIDLRRVQAFALLALAFEVIAVASLFGHMEAMPVVLTGVLAFNFAIACLFCATQYEDQGAMRGLFAGVAVGGTVVLLMVLRVGEYSWGRLASRASPNYWGRVAVSCFCGSFCIPRKWIRWPIIAIACVVLVLTSSRGSMMAVFAAIPLLVYLRVRVAATTMLVGYAIIGIVLMAAAPFAADRLFHFSDPRRGLSSGGTGRSLAWKQAWHAFEDNPLLGVGFRRHEHYITVASSAHNAYLATLAEVGLIGFVVYLVIVFGAIGWSVLRTLRGRESDVDVAVACFMTGFVIVGLVEAQAFTTGSPISLLMIFVAPYAWRRTAAYGRAKFGNAPR